MPSRRSRLFFPPVLLGLGLLVMIAARVAATDPLFAIHLPLIVVSGSTRLQPFASGLPGVTDLTHSPDGRFFAVFRDGLIYEIGPDGRLGDGPFLDIHNRVESDYYEQGLLGLAFHPDFAANGYIYVYYSEVSDDAIASAVLARYTAEPGGTAAYASEERLLITPHEMRVHYGGALHFGPDGYLYVASGDGTLYPQPDDQPLLINAQLGNNLLGKILRLDVNGGVPYAIPPDNPFVADDSIRDEIFLMGLRNPWRFSFDRVTGDLYVADVGHHELEEVNFVPAGASGLNFGWPCFEGNADGPVSEGCNAPANYTFPVYTYDHTEGRCAIVGGYVYRGHDMPWLNGQYLFADYCSGDIWALLLQDGATRVAHLNLEPKSRWSTFGEDIDGNIYLGEWGEATTIYRLQLTDNR